MNIKHNYSFIILFFFYSILQVVWEETHVTTSVTPSGLRHFTTVARGVVVTITVESAAASKCGHFGYDILQL